MKTRKARALIRAYPQAVAGTPKLYSFRPTWDSPRFRLAYEADASIAAPPVIFLPLNPHFRKGYRVEVQGPRASPRRGVIAACC